MSLEDEMNKNDCDKLSEGVIELCRATSETCLCYGVHCSDCPFDSVDSYKLWFKEIVRDD